MRVCFTAITLSSRCTIQSIASLKMKHDTDTKTYKKPKRPMTTALMVIVAIGGVVFLWRQLFPYELSATANQRTFVCAETGKSFQHDLTNGEAEPILSPFTSRNTAWEGEPCYWTKDGNAKKSPTWVVLKKRMGLEEATYCPDCGREVVGHNAEVNMPPQELMDKAE